jgi:2-polyprenyl-3-methyl-5-hydroxy-6-metoxy-1,4-benzoquinol methylase
VRVCQEDLIVGQEQQLQRESMRREPRVLESNPMTVAAKQQRFPFLQEFAAEMQIPEDNLIQVFRVESEFHRSILETDDAARRKVMYAELYAAVHPLLRPTPDPGDQSPQVARGRQARLLVLQFQKELVGKSVLDLGCGDGHFLLAIHGLLPHGDLWGLDVSEVQLPADNAGHAQIRFVCQDIVSFSLGRSFEVVFSNQVLEHLAPSDLSEHFRSIHAALSPGGRFIVSLPNRFWGPSDVTRIVDNTYTGRISAQGSHLNESSYGELIPLLRDNGFCGIKTVLPFAHRLPPLRSVRVSPWPKRLLETSVALRALTHALRRRGRAVFTNPVILICRKDA